MRFNKKNNNRPILWLMLAVFILSLVMTGCASDEDDDDASGGGSGIFQNLAVVNTKGDDESSISVINYVTGDTYNDLLVVGGSCDMAQYGDMVFIIDKSNDRIVKFDPEARAMVTELAVTAAAGPNSIAFASSTKAYVTLSDLPEVWVINPQTMTQTGSVDISSLPDDRDGDPDPDQYQAMIKGDRLYVTLRRSTGRFLNDYSSLAVIDTTTDTLLGEIELLTNGVSGMAQDALGGQTYAEDTLSGDLFVHVGGSMTDAVDGAVEYVDVDAETTTVLATEDQYGGTIAGWVFDTNTTGWAISGLSEPDGSGFGLYRFELDPAGATATFTAIDAFQGQLYTYALACTSDGKVLVGNKDEDDYGIYVYDSTNDYAEVFDSPLDVGLIPNRILVLK